jgi:predicted membrane-bound dolichyl-phosphate-mannose-protein mannosyltransferase
VTYCLGGKTLFSKDKITFLPRHFKESCRSIVALLKKNSRSKRKHSKYMNVENNNTMDNNTQKRNTLFQKK